MPNVTPVQIFPNYTADSTGITIPYTDLPGLTAALANPTTGNAAEVLRAIIDATYTKVSALAPANKPKKMSITKPAATLATGGAAGDLRETYSTSFDMHPTGLAVADEP